MRETRLGKMLVTRLEQDAGDKAGDGAGDETSEAGSDSEDEAEGK